MLPHLESVSDDLSMILSCQSSTSDPVYIDEWMSLSFGFFGAS